jgi:mRNA (guanine-N7-)-methyltransferase
MTLDALKDPFNVISCQFAFHYSFETKERAQLALKNISQLLVSGGMFFGTIPNAYRLV